MVETISTTNPNASPVAKQIVKRWESLKQKRTNWDQVWQEVSEFALPHKSFITRDRAVQGERLDADVYDSTARQAVQVMAAGFHTNLTNPASRWFSIRLQREDLNDVQDVKIWLKEVEERIFDVLNGSNFNQQINECYLDLGVFGTAVLFEEVDPRDIIRFQCLPINEIVIDEDSRQRVNTIYRKIKFSASQAFDRWGEAAGKRTRELIQQKKFDETVEFIQCIFERDDFDPSKQDGLNKPIASITVELKDFEVVAEGGFDEFPIFAPRFKKVSGDLYGYSPAIVTLPDIKQLNVMDETIIEAAQKIVSPPLILPHDGFLLPLVTEPNGVNYKLSGNANDKIEPLQTGANLPIGLEMEDRRREIINKAFFVDLFQLLSLQTEQMTATEVVQRISEKMAQLGPILGRLQNELLNPIIERTFGILFRLGVLPEPPEVIQDEQLIIEYISPLAKSQKIEEINSINNLLVLVGGVGQFQPEVFDKIDTDKTVDRAADIFGVPADIVRDDDQVSEIRAIRAEQQAAVTQAQQIADLADTTKVVSEAEKNLAEVNDGRQK